MTTDQHSFESRMIEVSPRIRLRAIIRRGGAGLPFLLIHGLASNARMWDGVAEHLAPAGHDSLAIDQRGHGESAQVDFGFDFATLSDDLTRVIESTVNRPVLAVGQSWGGNVALELAARSPGLVAGVGLIDGGFLRLADDFATWSGAQRALRPPTLNGVTLTTMEKWMRSRDEGFFEGSIPGRLANFEVLPDGSIRNRLRHENHIAILRHLWSHDPDEVGAGVGVPIHVVAVPGTARKRQRVADFAAMAAAKVHWREGHHDIHAQQPEIVAGLLLQLAQEAAR